MSSHYREEELVGRGGKGQVMFIVTMINRIRVYLLKLLTVYTC